MQKIIWQTSSLRGSEPNLFVQICNCLFFSKMDYFSKVPHISFLLIFVLMLQAFSVVHSKPYHIPIKHRLYSEYALKSNNVSRGSHIGQIKQRATSINHGTYLKNNLSGLSGDGYYIDVDIGTPPQRMQVLIDTGSANFAVAADSDPEVSHYFQRKISASFADGGEQIYVPYTEGEWQGILGTDVVSLPFALNITLTVYLACITESRNFFVQDSEWQGILGLAYAELARPDSSYLPFWDALMLERPDISNVFSVQLCGSSFIHTQPEPLMEGSLTIGGIEPTLFKGPLMYTPIYKKWYYEVVLTDLQVGGTSLDLDCKEYNFDKTIIDTGTTNIRLPSKVFESVITAIEDHLQKKKDLTGSPGPYFYLGDDVICFRDMAQPFSSFPIISFFLLQSENTSFRLDVTPQHYLRLVENSDEATSSQSCVRFGFSSSTSGTVLGAVLMEGFYVIFDRERSRIGFGQTTCPLPDPDHPLLNSTIAGPFASKKNQSECAYEKPDDKEKTFLIVSYVMAAMSVVLVLPLVMLFFMWTRRILRRKQGYKAQDDSSEAQTVLTD